MRTLAVCPFRQFQPSNIGDIAGTAALATCGVLGMVPAAAQASSASAYDAATGTTVLFGGLSIRGGFVTPDTTWTWG